MASRRHGASAPATTRTIRHDDWDGDVTAGATYAEIAFLDVDMAELRTSRAVFEQCIFRGVSLNASVHDATAFVNCTFTNCNLFEATFTGCKLVGSTFDRCRLSLLTVAGGDWSFVGLPGADLRRAQIRDVRMREADLTEARFDGAVLTNVDLSGSWLHRTTWDGCDLRGSDLSALDPREADVRAAIVTWEQAVVLATNLGLDVR